MGFGGLPSPLQHPGEGLGAGGSSAGNALVLRAGEPAEGLRGGAMDASVLGPPRSRGLQTRPCVPAWRCAQNRLCVSPPLDGPSIPRWARAHLLPRSHAIQSPSGGLVETRLC